MQPNKDSNSFGWLVWGFVTIAVAAIGIFGTQPELLCDVFEVGCPESTDISGLYWMDNNAQRVIHINAASGNRYRIGEDTGSWPWQGTITVEDGDITGTATFTKTGVQITIEGYVAGDGRLYVEYHFEPPRIDRHWLYPA